MQGNGTLQVENKWFLCKVLRTVFYYVRHIIKWFTSLNVAYKTYVL